MTLSRSLPHHDLRADHQRPDVSFAATPAISRHPRRKRVGKREYPDRCVGVSPWMKPPPGLVVGSRLEQIAELIGV